MKIKVNGEEIELNSYKEVPILSKTLEGIGYKPNSIVVELNNTIVNSKKWGEVVLKDGDKLEIVSVVGGG